MKTTDIIISDLSYYGRAYDLLNLAFIACNSARQIIYINQTALQLARHKKDFYFGKEAFINEYFSGFIEFEFFSQAKLIHFGQQLVMHGKVIDWTSIQLKIDKQPAFFLIGEDITKEEALYKDLENTFTQVTGQSTLDRLSIQEYINEMRFYLENIIGQMPCYVYWKDLNFRYLGCNKLTLNLMQLEKIEDIIGRTDFDFGWDYQVAQSYREVDQEIFNTQLPKINIEETLIDNNGEIKYLLGNKVPIFSREKRLIGLVGIAVDITSQKIAEQKEEEALAKAASNYAKAEEQAKFVKIANQVAHDIRSPLSSLLMIVKSCDEIPEQYRIALREAAVSISDIANNLLNTYKNSIAVKKRQQKDKVKEVLVSALLLELLTEKKYQYQDLPVKFSYDFTSTSYFAFAHIDSSAFRRMVSNLINNAVDAFDKKPGKVLLKLIADNEWLKIIVEDNGKGMPSEIIDKILSDIAFTEGKKEGHGIGLTQVRETLTAYQGEITIESEPNKGTTIILTFPRMTSPHWIADKIQLFANDIVVILDDDISIHGAWDTHFSRVSAEYPTLVIQHFDRGDNALAFIKQLNTTDKERVFLLTDFELLKQELTGLHVVEQSEVKRSVLVTSHYTNKQVLKQAAATNTKILPKQLASEIPIIVNKKIDKETIQTPISLRDIDLIVVDDNESFTEMLGMFMFSDYKVDYYHHPEHFLKNIQQYDKQIKIYIDGHFQGSGLNGLAVAETLHEAGFTCLYLLSGERPEQVPDYLTVILKDDLDGIQSTLSDKKAAF